MGLRLLFDLSFCHLAKVLFDHNQVVDLGSIVFIHEKVQGLQFHGEMRKNNEIFGQQWNSEKPWNIWNKINPVKSLVRDEN